MTFNLCKSCMRTVEETIYTPFDSLIQIIYNPNRSPNLLKTGFNAFAWTTALYIAFLYKMGRGLQRKSFSEATPLVVFRPKMWSARCLEWSHFFFKGRVGIPFATPAPLPIIQAPLPCPNLYKKQWRGTRFFLNLWPQPNRFSREKCPIREVFTRFWLFEYVWVFKLTLYAGSFAELA